MLGSALHNGGFQRETAGSWFEILLVMCPHYNTFLQWMILLSSVSVLYDGFLTLTVCHIAFLPFLSLIYLARFTYSLYQFFVIIFPCSFPPISALFLFIPAYLYFSPSRSCDLRSNTGSYMRTSVLRARRSCVPSLHEVTRIISFKRWVHINKKNLKNRVIAPTLRWHRSPTLINQSGNINLQFPASTDQSQLMEVPHPVQMHLLQPMGFAKMD